MNRARRLHALLTAALLVGTLTGCSLRGGPMPTDAAGLTQEDVATMSLHEEFEAYRQHYHHMQELLAGAQRSVNDGPGTGSAGTVCRASVATARAAPGRGHAQQLRPADRSDLVTTRSHR